MMFEQGFYRRWIFLKLLGCKTCLGTVTSHSLDFGGGGVALFLFGGGFWAKGLHGEDVLFLSRVQGAH